MDMYDCPTVEKLSFPSSLLHDVDTDASPDQSCESTCCSSDVSDELPAKTASQVAKQLEVESLGQHVEDRRALVSQLQDRVTTLENWCLAGQTSTEVETALEETRKQALNCAEDLLEDMLALDKLSDLASDDRATRKATIAQIETMLDVLDDTKAKLSMLRRRIMSKPVAAQIVPISHASTDCPERNTSRPRPGDSDVLQSQGLAAKKPDTFPPPSEEIWQQVPLQLLFQQQHEADRYVVWARANKFQLEDLRLELSGDVHRLLITGLCVPTAEETRELQEKVLMHYAGQTFHLSGSLGRMYAELGKGRFGKFAHVLQIPADVDIQQIKASSQHGALCVVFPKKQHVGCGGHRCAECPVSRISY